MSAAHVVRFSSAAKGLKTYENRNIIERVFAAKVLMLNYLCINMCIICKLEQ